MANKLVEGVVGKQIVLYFNTFEDKEPTEAEVAPGKSNNARDEMNYRITFADGSVSDWHVTFEPGMSFRIVSAEMFNEVI